MASSTVVYPGTWYAVVCSGDYMYLTNNNKIQKITLSTGVIDTPNWASTSLNSIQGMAIYNGCIYAVGKSSIIQISLDVPNPTTWATVGYNLRGIFISGDSMYVTNMTQTTPLDNQVIQLSLTSSNVISTVTITDYAMPTQLCVLGNYVYTCNLYSYGIVRVDLTNNTADTSWYNLPNTQYQHSEGIAAYGNYIYASVASPHTSNPNSIVTITLDGTTLKTFDTTYDSTYLYIFNEQLYALTTTGVVVFEISPATDTLVYSQTELDASSTETAMGKRGTAMLRRQGQRRPVAVLEMITRTSIFRHRRRVIYTTHHDCTITFLQHQSAISGRFVHVNRTLPETVTCMSHAASGRYTSAKLAIKPNGNMREVTINPQI